MKLLSTSNCYFNINLICNKFNIDVGLLLHLIEEESISYVEDNVFRYDRRIYINLQCLYFIIITYNNKYNFNKNIINILIKNIDNITNIGVFILGRYIIQEELYMNYYNILVFNNKYNAGYIYLLKCENKLKIGVTSNPIIRLKHISREEQFECTYQGLFYYNSMEDAFCIEKKLHNIYKENNIYGEWFKYDSKIVKEIKVNFSNNYMGLKHISMT